ncbi:hypothetical protein HY637_04080 [Candidatus Woesearchaeota archaeon]|nr:hypothetical protein [Candidatus Woesearchaeota archaeon]
MEKLNEKQDRGFEVAEMTFRHGALPLIVTGKDYNMQSTGNRSLQEHGPTTFMLPTGDVFPGKKDNPEVWKDIYEAAIKYLNGNGKSLYNAIKRSLQYNRGGFDTRAKSGMTVFSPFIQSN